MAGAPFNHPVIRTPRDNDILHSLTSDAEVCWLVGRVVVRAAGVGCCTDWSVEAPGSGASGPRAFPSPEDALSPSFLVTEGEEVGNYREIWLLN